MSEMTVALPDSISEAEAKVCLAAKLFEVGRLSVAKRRNLPGIRNARSSNSWESRKSPC